ncbi:MAG: hypothetical protein WD492_12650 [Alkalispirochaeta sp.]
MKRSVPISLFVALTLGASIPIHASGFYGVGGLLGVRTMNTTISDVDYSLAMVQAHFSTVNLYLDHDLPEDPGLHIRFSVGTPLDGTLSIGESATLDVSETDRSASASITGGPSFLVLDNAGFQIRLSPGGYASIFYLVWIEHFVIVTPDYVFPASSGFGLLDLSTGPALDTAISLSLSERAVLLAGLNIALPVFTSTGIVGTGVDDDDEEMKSKVAFNEIDVSGTLGVGFSF